MANNDVQIAIKDPETARGWLGEVVLINEDYRDAMKEAGSTLDDMQNFADGTMVDEFVDLGSKILTAADATFDAINAIADTVNTFLEKTGSFVSEAVSKVKGVINLFG